MNCKKFVFLLLLLFVYNISAQNPKSKSSTPPNKARILIIRAGEASSKSQVKNRWFSALTESYYQFRLQPVINCSVVPSWVLLKILPASKDFGVEVSESDVFEAANKVKATHILIHNYEVVKAENLVNYYLEVLIPQDKSVIMTFDESIPLANLGEQLDKCTEIILKEINVKPSAQEMELLKKPVLSSNPKNLELLGSLISKSAELRGSDAYKAAQKFLKLTSTSPTFALAFYSGAYVFQSVRDFKHAAQLFSHLISNNGFEYPLFYVQTSMNYRLSKSPEMAKKILSLAEKKGWETRDLILEKAHVLEIMGEDYEAKKLFNKVRKTDPNHPDVLLFIARQNRKAGIYNRALELSNRVIKMKKNLGEAYLEKAKNLIPLKNPSEALKALHRVSQFLPNDPEPQVMMGDIHFAKKDYAKAADCFANAIKEMPDNLELLLKVTNSYKLAGNPKTALTIITKYKPNFKDNKEISKEMGLLHFELKDTTKASALLEQCLNIKPPDSRVFMAMADIYAAKGKSSQAINMYEKAKPLVKDKNSVKFALAKLCYMKKEYEKAEKNLRSLVITDPKYPQANGLLADILRIKGHYRDALNFYKKERQFQGDNVNIQRFIAQIYFKLNNLSTAQKEYEKLIKLDPTDVQAYFQLTLIALKQKNAAKAQEYLTQAEVSGKGDKDIYRKLGEGFASAGSLDKAIETYRKSLKFDPGNEDVWKELANVYIEAKKDTAAAGAYIKIYTINESKNSSYLAKAGHIYYDRGLKENAYKTYYKFLEKGYKDPLVNVNMASIEFKAKKYKQTISLLKNLGDKYASDTKVIKMLLFSYKNTGDISAALPYMKKLLEKTPNDKDIIEMAAQSYEKTGDLKSASVMYKKYLSFPETKKHQEYAFHLASLYEKQKAMSFAVNQYNSNIISYPDDFRNYKQLTQLYLNSRNYNNAASILAKAVKRPSAPPKTNKTLAEIYIKQGKKSLAATEYKKYLAKVQTDSLVWYKLGSIYYSQKLYEDAIFPLEKASSLMPKKISCLNELAVSYIQSGDMQKTINTYNKILKLVPNNEDIWIKLAEIYLKTKNDTAVSRVYIEIYKLNEQKNSSYLAKAGHIYYEIGMKKKAYKIYSDFLKKGYTDPLVNVNTSIMEYGAKKYEQTISLLKDLGDKYASDARVIKMLAFSYYKTNKYAEAVPYIKKILAKTPDDKNVVEMAAIAYEKSGDPRSASAMYKKYLTFKKTKQHQEYAYHLASLYEKQKAMSLAVEQYKANITAYPNDLRNHERLIKLYIDSRDYTHAIDVLKKATQNPSAPTKMHKDLAEFYVKQGEKSLAATAYENYLKKSPKDSLAWYKLGSIYYSLKSYQKAINPLEKASELMPEKVSCLYELAVSYIQSKDTIKAVFPLKKAHTLRSNDIKILTLLSQCHETLKDTTELINILQKRAALEKTNFNLNFQLGRLLFETNKPDLAIKALETASNAKPSDVSTHVKLIKLYTKNKNNPMRISHINAALKYAPDNANLHFEKARYHVIANELDKAETSLKRTIELKPDHAHAHFYYGNMLKRKENYQKALYHFNQALKYSSKNTKYMLEFAETASLIGDMKLTFKTIDKAIELEPDNGAIIQRAGALYFHADKRKKAEQLLLKGLQMDKACPWCHEQLGYIYYSESDYRTAIGYLEKAIEKNEKNDSAMILLANALSYTNELKRAKKYYEKSFSLNPQNFEILYRICAVNIKLGMINEAELLLANNKQGKTSEWKDLAQGRIMEAKNQIPAAVLSYSKVLHTLPNNSDALMGMGRIYLQQGKYNKAIESFSMAMVEKSDNADILIGMGKAYFGQKNYAAALELFLECEKRQPDHPEVYYMLGLVYSKKKKHAKAINALKKGIKYNANNADLYFALGLEYQVTRNYNNAAENYLKALEYNDTKAVKIYKYLGDIYYNYLIDHKMAKKYYNKYIKAGGTDEDVKEALERL